MTANTIESQGTIFEIESSTPGVYTEVGELQTWDGPGGGSAKVIDVTNLRSSRKEKRMGLPDEGQLTIAFNTFFDDAGQTRMYAARNSRALTNFRITYTDLTVDSFAGFVLMFKSGGGIDDVVKGSATIEISGANSRV